MKNELINKLTNFNGFSSDLLYDDLILLEKTSNFNEVEFNKFLIAYSLIGNKIVSPQQITEYWSKLNKVDPSKINRLNNSLNDISPDWIGMSLPKENLDIQNPNEQTEYIKIYLSVDNNSLHQFANQFLLSCLEYGYSDFDFKINKNVNINRRDNVVVYCTDKNFGQYVNLIQEVIKNNPKIAFNQPHLLGIPYDEHIYCGIDFDNGKTSYTDKLCEGMFKALQNGKTPEEIVDSIDTFKMKHYPSIYAMADMTSNFGVKH